MSSSLLILHRKACLRPEVQAAVDEVQASGAELCVRVTWGPEDVASFVREGLASGVERFIAGGGDGTVNAVANAMLDAGAHDASLAVMPLGTANDFARGAGIPIDDLTAALQLAVCGAVSEIDLGMTNGRYFINVASGGFGAEITAMTPPDLKRLLGGAAYTLVGLAKAWQLKPYVCEVRLDGAEAVSVELLALAVGNNRYAGGGYEVAPQAELSDGLLDFAALSPLDMERIQQAVLKREKEGVGSLRPTRYVQARECHLRSDRPMQLNLDGEPMVASEFEFTVVPGGLRCVLGPPPADQAGSE